MNLVSILQVKMALTTSNSSRAWKGGLMPTRPANRNPAAAGLGAEAEEQQQSEQAEGTGTSAVAFAACVRQAAGTHPAPG